MADAFEDVAKKLNLRRGAAGMLKLPFVHGELEGVQVRARWGDRGSPVEALLEPALDLGLDIKRMGFTARFSMDRKLWLWDPNWDMEVDSLCDEPLRGAALFESEARRAVLGLNATNVETEIDDHRVAVFVMQAYDESLERAFHAVARTAKIIDEARRTLKPAKVLAEHAESLQRFAGAKGLATSTTPLAAWGDVGGARLQVSFPRTGVRQHGLLAQIEPLEGKLGPGLLIRRETLMDRVRTFLGGQDLKTGDAVFDPAFLVQAIEAERTLSALDGDARALLLDLRKKLEVVTLDDRGLTLQGASTDVAPDELGGLLEIGCVVVESVARASGAVHKGAYR